jgi:hypothetical protein
MRTSVPAAMAALALSAAVLLSGAAPASADVAPSPSASAGQKPFVEANPSTTRAGDEITLRASCVENLQDATVESPPLGEVTVRPDHGFLTATKHVPTTTEVGDYALTLTCAGHTTADATGVFHVVARVEPTRGPATGGGGTAPGRNAPLLMGGGAVALILGLALAVVSVVRRRRFG